MSVAEYSSFGSALTPSPATFTVPEPFAVHGVSNFAAAAGAGDHQQQCRAQQQQRDQPGLWERLHGVSFVGE
jgi:hypothetical protein